MSMQSIFSESPVPPVGPSFDPSERVILKGLVGSKAYGLDTENSDDDFVAVYVAPTDAILGLDGPNVAKHSTALHEPVDITYHEVGKYLSLALKCNPTVLDILWLDDYVIKTWSGGALVNVRKKCLSTSYVRAAYGGYARQQAHRLRNRMEQGKEGFSSDLQKRTEKHGRHCARLITQCRDLLTTGQLRVNVAEDREAIFDAGRQAKENPAKYSEEVLHAVKKLDVIPSCLPDQPDRAYVNAVLVRMRKGIGFDV